MSPESDAAPIAARPGRGPKSVGGARRAERRREIVAAAAAVFYEKGYDASSTQDIANVAGILKGSLYYYVKSKEDFLFEIVQDMHEGALRIVMPVASTAGDSLVKLALIIIRQVEYFAANHVFATVFFREYRALSEERRQPIESQGDLYRQQIRNLLRTGMDEGSIIDTLDPSTAAVAIVEMLNSIHRWYHPDGSRTASDVARYFAMVLVVGVASPDGLAAHGGLDGFRQKVQVMSANVDPQR